MTIEGNGPEFQAYIKDFIAKSQWKWMKCDACGNWISRAKKDKRCPLCPPVRKNEKTDQDEEVYDPVTKSYVPKGLF